MMLITLRACNASSQVVSSIKSTFVDNLIARKVMQVSMANPYWFNSMETKAFHQLNHHHHSMVQNQL